MIYIHHHIYSRTPFYRDARREKGLAGKSGCPVYWGPTYTIRVNPVPIIAWWTRRRALDQNRTLDLAHGRPVCYHYTTPPPTIFITADALNQEPTDTSKQPIRTTYLGHVTGYQPIKDHCLLIRSDIVMISVRVLWVTILSEVLQNFTGPIQIPANQSVKTILKL
eukprot:sb/3472528/